MYLPLIDVYLAIHLAHRTTHSDAPAPLHDAVRSVQNSLLAAAATKATTTMPSDGTLGDLWRKSGVAAKGGKKSKDARGAWDASALVEAVAERRAPYVVSTFEIGALSRFLDVDVIVEGDAHDAGKPKRRHLVLRLRDDGAGHDLALAPVPSGGFVTSFGHRMLFDSVI